MVGRTIVSESSSWRDGDPRLKLGLDEVWRSITFQANQVDSIKARSGAALTVAGVLIALSSSNAFLQHKAHFWDWAAIIAFIGEVVAVVVVMWPRDWVFDRRPDALRWYWENGQTYDQMMAGLFADAERHHRANEDTLDGMEIAFLAVMVGLGWVLVSVMLALITR